LTTARAGRRAEDSQFVEDEGDASDEEVVGGFAGFDFENVDWGSDIVGAEDDAVGGEIDIAQEETRADANGEEVGAVGAVRHERDVVPVDEDNCVWQDQGLHGRGVGGGYADGDKALPGAAWV